VLTVNARIGQVENWPRTYAPILERQLLSANTGELVVNTDYFNRSIPIVYKWMRVGARDCGFRYREMCVLQLTSLPYRLVLAYNSQVSTGSQAVLDEQKSACMSK